MVVLMAVMYYSEMYRVKLAKGKGCGGVQGHQTPAFKSPLPVGSQRRHLIPPETNCDNTCEVLLLREAHWRLSAQAFYWGLIV